jgi:hypothetical protein
MASGHVNRAEQAEHMAAPTNAANVKKSPCQSGAVHTWPITAISDVRFDGEFRGTNGPSGDSLLRQLMTRNGRAPSHIGNPV